MRRLFAILLLIASALVAGGRAQAARPLLDQPQWDAYFTLYARDTAVPWKPTTIRLDTFSSAPVDFAAYEVDPAEVIIAGSEHVARPIDTARLHPVATWRFVPPSGYRFVSSDVTVPLGQRAGFFVVEARRGNVARQIWIDRTRIGLEAQASPRGTMLWAVDLGTGKPLVHLTVQLLVGSALIERKTDASGTIVWRKQPAPRFALAQMGSDRAFLSFLPQAPIPRTVVGLRLESPVVRAGDDVHLVGFARVLDHDAFGVAKGDVHLSLVDRGRPVGSKTVVLDRAGAFEAALPTPKDAKEGPYSILASVDGAAAGANVTVDARSNLALEIVPRCPCTAGKDFDVDVVATRDGSPAAGVGVSARVVRSPHVLPPGASSDDAWGTTVVYDQPIATNAQGIAKIRIGAPTDGLASTYGVRASATGASARTVVIVPTAPVALQIQTEQSSVGPGDDVGLDVRAFDPTTGAPVGNLPVVVRLVHGPEVVRADTRLDASGRAHVALRPPSLGTNLASAEVQVAGARALDVTSILVAPDSHAATASLAGVRVEVKLARDRYRPGEIVAVDARVDGGQGDALVALEGDDIYGARIAPVHAGRATAQFKLGDTQGDVRVATAFVRDGAIVDGSAPLNIDAPGHPRLTSLALDRPAYEPGAQATVAIHDGDGHDAATVAVRLTDKTTSGPAYFDDAPALLATGTTSSLDAAAPSPPWHAWVALKGSAGAKLFSAGSPLRARSSPPTVGVATPQTLYWHVERASGGRVTVPLPNHAGRYVLSILKMWDDGDVGAASTTVVVK
ncbi:MAG: hypothetical protein ACREM6_01765 [Vulcanimicrobiaceae bacterium]